MAHRSGFMAVLVLLVVSLSFAERSPAADQFIRGDANSDGVVSVSDAFFVTKWIFLGGVFPPCLNACDANDTGQIDLQDGFTILHMLSGEPSTGDIPPPFPSLGTDPTGPNNFGWEGHTDCDAYGGGTPLEDPGAKIEVLSTTVLGGANRMAILTLQVSNSRDVSGCFLRLSVAGNIFSETYKVRIRIGETTGRFEWEALHPVLLEHGIWSALARVRGGKLEASFLTSIVDPLTIPPGQDVALLQIALCLNAGTEAGEYPMTLEAGELADFETGRATPAAGVAGTLAVLRKVEDTLCNPPLIPRDLSVTFALGETTAGRGLPAFVPFSIKADRASSGFSFSIDFDEGVLHGDSIEPRFSKPDGTPYAFQKFEINNDNAHPGSAGLDEGYMVGAAVISLTDTGSVLPSNVSAEVLECHFTVSPEAPLGSTELKFEDGGVGSGGPVKNFLYAGGVEITPAVASSFVFINGLVNIIPDTSPFVRGDSNSDGTVNISDPNFTLSWLFLGGDRPKCMDAADANDDGQVNIGDPIATLNFLFLGTFVLPPPGTSKGTDPTKDNLGCLGS